MLASIIADYFPLSFLIFVAIERKNVVLLAMEKQQLTFWHVCLVAFVVIVIIALLVVAVFNRIAQTDISLVKYF